MLIAELTYTDILLIAELNYTEKLENGPGIHFQLFKILVLLQTPLAGIAEAKDTKQMNILLRKILVLPIQIN